MGLSVTADARQVARQYLDDLVRAATAADSESIARAFEAILSCLQRGGTVFLAGNGGSAAASSHIASDWLEVALRELATSRVVSLTDNVAILTRIGNDVGYDEIFSRQIQSFAKAGDCLVLISVSGRSPNLLRAADVAISLGVSVISLVGCASPLAERSHHAVIMGSSDYGVTEDLHAALGHAMVRFVRGGLPHLCEQSTRFRDSL